jgi:hypothetical protein
MYVLTMQLLLLPFQFLSVSSREHPMDLITFNSMRQLPGNTLDPDDQARKFLRGPLGLSMGSPKNPNRTGTSYFFCPLFFVLLVTSGFLGIPPISTRRAFFRPLLVAALSMPQTPKGRGAHLAHQGVVHRKSLLD